MSLADSLHEIIFLVSHCDINYDYKGHTPLWVPVNIILTQTINTTIWLNMEKLVKKCHLTVAANVWITLQKA